MVGTGRARDGHRRLSQLAGAPVEPRISIITLGVKDLDRAVRFYRDGLSLPLSAASSKEIAFFSTSGTVLALFPRDELAADANVPPQGGGFSGITLAHNVRERGEVDSVIAQALAAGAVLVKRAAEASWGGYSGYFADPDGHLWEVAWNPNFRID